MCYVFLTIYVHIYYCYVRDSVRDNELLWVTQNLKRTSYGGDDEMRTLSDDFISHDLS